MPLVPIAFSVCARRGGKKPSDRWAESVCHVLSVEELAGHRNFGQYPSWKDVGEAVCQALGVTGVVAGDDECRSVDAPEVIERCKGAVMADCRCGRRTVGVSARNSLSDQVGDQRLKIRNEQFPGGLQTAGTGTLGETIHQIGVCGFVRIVLYRFSTEMTTADRAIRGCWRHVRKTIVPPSPAPTRWARVSSSACMIAMTSLTY